MDGKKLREKVDHGLARARDELEALPDEYSEENWKKHQAILARIRGLNEIKALFAAKREPHTKIEWGLLY